MGSAFGKCSASALLNILPRNFLFRMPTDLSGVCGVLPEVRKSRRPRASNPDSKIHIKSGRDVELRTFGIETQSLENSRLPSIV